MQSEEHLYSMILFLQREKYMCESICVHIYIYIYHRKILWKKTYRFMVQFSSVTQSGQTLCDSMNRSMPSLPVNHRLPEFTQTHVHRVSDAIQPSHPLSSPSPPAPNLSQHQGLFQWVSFFAWGSQSIGVSALASFLPMNTQDWSPLGWTGWIFLQSKGLSTVFSNTTVQKHQFFGAQPALWYKFHSHTWLLENHSFDYMDLCWQSYVSAFSYAV